MPDGRVLVHELSLAQLNGLRQVTLSHVPTSGRYGGNMFRHAELAEADGSYVIDPGTKQAIGRRLAAALTRRNVNQAQLAIFAGVSRQAVNHWVKGRDLPQLGTLYRIAQEYKLSVDHLLFGSIYTPEALDLARQIADMPENERRALQNIFGKKPPGASK